ncbi:MAG: DUF4386 domain-containing protein [Candidatus Zixiibacteriota bacterium]
MAMNTNSYRTTAVVTGILFLTTDITAIVGLLLYQPLLTNPQFITSADVSHTPIYIGALLETVLAVCNAGTALALYPILKKQNQSLALGYVIFRALEATIILVGVMSILTVLTLRLDFLAVGGNPEVYQMIGKAFVAFQRWTFLFGPNIVLPLNAAILGYLLFKSKLVPRYISSLYLFDAPVLFTSSILILFGCYSQTSVPAIVIAMPMLAFELLFSGWLIVKGFNQTALDSLAARVRPATF